MEACSQLSSEKSWCPTVSSQSFHAPSQWNLVQQSASMSHYKIQWHKTMPYSSITMPPCLPNVPLVYKMPPFLSITPLPHLKAPCRIMMPHSFLSQLSGVSLQCLCFIKMVSCLIRMLHGYTIVSHYPIMVVTCTIPVVPYSITVVLVSSQHNVVSSHRNP